MRRYIDADALITALRENCSTVYQGDPWYGSEPMLYKDDVKECIDEAPTADVRENVRGEWIERTYGQYECSVCGEKFCIPYIDNKNYCLSCGADMRGEKHG